MEGGFIPESEPNQIKKSLNEGQQRTDHVTVSSITPAWALPRQIEDDKGSGCTRCDNLSYTDEYFKAFGVYLCNSCRRGEKLISKSTAKQQYQVTDKDISKLGSIQRSNPRKRDWQPMRLYLESQVQEVAFAKHGGAAGIEARARAALDMKLKTRLKKRQDENEKKERDAERLKRIRTLIEKEAEQDQRYEGCGDPKNEEII